MMKWNEMSFTSINYQLVEEDVFKNIGISFYVFGTSKILMVDGLCCRLFVIDMGALLVSL